MIDLPVEERSTRDATAALSDDEQERPQVGYVPGYCHGHAHRRVHVGSCTNRTVSSSLLK